VKNLLITKEDLQKALVKCLNAPNPDAALKEYFLSNELISPQNVERLARAARTLSLRQKEYKFGAIAIRKGFINKSVLKLALEEQEKQMREKKKFHLVGDLLVEADMLTAQQRDYILKLQKRLRPEIKTDLEKPEAASPGPKDSKEVLADGKALDAASSELEEDASNLLAPEIIGGGIKLEVSKDFMAAFLSKTDYFDKDILVSQLKEFLFDKGIINGIVDDEMIEGFINSSGFKTKTFRVAKGIAPVQGKDAKVEFFFNTDYLQAGGVKEDGVIDFKDRGEIPFVDEDTVLAEKIPMVESRTGKNIYGDEIETIPGKDIVLKIGKGAKFSEDGYKVLAAVKGSPKYALSGHIFVHQEYVTEGDVDYETGHINYDGNVIIKGRIKSGFKVKGNNVDAIEIDGGIVDASGDVKISGGINEGKIYSRGNVFARFIHNSEIICMGDVVVEKEIVDSTVESSGACLAKMGKLISSRISAKMGIHARNVGTEMAGPNTLKVGYDAFVDKEHAENKIKIDRVKKQREIIEEKKKTLAQENAELQKQITELAHVQDRSQLEEKDLNSQISSMGETSADQSQIAELKEKIAQLNENAKTAEAHLDECFEKTEEIEEIVAKYDEDIKTLEQRLADYTEERANLSQWSTENPGKPVVIVDGAILAETVIIGKHSEKRVTETIRHAKVSEVRVSSSEDGRNLDIYEMQVGNI
ncbi:MAG: DUF342 domain-containing protein, partial [Proteobacteria bacterium]|nr:DUF342 domain-containing protein [Pseudomonadota bacterium]